jgi:hypothetical protein
MLAGAIAPGNFTSQERHYSFPSAPIAWGSLLANLLQMPGKERKAEKSR